MLLEESLLYRRQFGRAIAAFYGFNTLGAVAGSHLREGGYLVRKCGLPGTGSTAACLSLAAAGIAWLFAGTVAAGTEATGFQFSLGKQTPWKLLLVSVGTGTLFLGLETEKDRGFSNINDFFLFIYLYRLNGRVERAEALAGAQANSTQKDRFVDWLWGELQAQFGFHPPR